MSASAKPPSAADVARWVQAIRMAPTHSTKGRERPHELGPAQPRHQRAASREDLMSTERDNANKSIAELRAKSPQHAEVADLLQSMLDGADAQRDAPPGVTPIKGSRPTFERLMSRLRAKGTRLMYGARNDNS